MIAMMSPRSRFKMREYSAISNRWRREASTGDKHINKAGFRFDARRLRDYRFAI